MKTYIVTSYTNYGQYVHLINAYNIEDVRSVADKCDTIWSGYDVEELDTETYGIIFVGGGEADYAITESGYKVNEFKIIEG